MARFTAELKTADCIGKTLAGVFFEVNLSARRRLVR
jgi:hypothetical protein